MTFPWLVLGVLGSAAIAGIFARITRQYAIAAVAGSAALLLLHSLFYFHYTSDDAYISYRYARNLADGVGLVWNPGEHVEGYSNFLWVVILAGLNKLGPRHRRKRALARVLAGDRRGAGDVRAVDALCSTARRADRRTRRGAAARGVGIVGAMGDGAGLRRRCSRC